MLLFRILDVCHSIFIIIYYIEIFMMLGSMDAKLLHRSNNHYYSGKNSFC